MVRRADRFLHQDFNQDLHKRQVCRIVYSSVLSYVERWNEEGLENNMGLSVAKQHLAPSTYPSVKDTVTVTIRSFQRSDQKECLQIFMDGFQEYIKNIAIAVLSRSLCEYGMKDIEKCYMSSEGSHMWVVECCSKVVRMVGLIQDKSHEPGVFELQRMYVVRHYRGMGIGKKMLIEVITHAKKHRIKVIVLRTSTTQVAAIQLYMKHGFEPVTAGSSSTK
ncbi:hypothetical protein ACROYT_G030945 [Oculina patagonica]